MTPSTSTSATSRVVTFEDIGVRRVINCRGTYTIVSGSRLLPQAAEAMARASDHYVHMDELMERVGQRLAELTGAEWGYITCGCAAALSQVAAACMAGGDPEKIARLPDTTGMPNEIVIQRAHRNVYDRALRLAGGVMVEVDTLGELQAALSERTALVFVNGDTERGDTIPPQEMIALARMCGIPTLVDAAAQRPDVPNRHLAMGADVVTYSGGKCLRGPQASGLALGNKALLKAAFLNGAPHHAMGRPMKAGKEEIMGLLTAVEAWILGRDHEAEWRQWEGYLERIRQAVSDLPTVSTRIAPPGAFNVAPLLVISWSPEVLGCTPAQAHQALWEGEPRITLHLLADGLGVLPYMIEAGDDEIAADRLRRTLSRRDWPPITAAAPPGVILTGDWEIELTYVYGRSQHALSLTQEEGLLTGRYCTPYNNSAVCGRVSGKRVTFSTVLGYQSNETRYEFEGAAEGEILAGKVSLDEFGEARWRASRQGRG